MKRFVLAGAVTILALSAVAAQGQGNPVYGVEAQQPSTGTLGFAQRTPDLRLELDSTQKATLVSALRGYQNSCEADRQALCADKADRKVGRCLAYHRLRLSSPCKHAIDSLMLARSGAL